MRKQRILLFFFLLFMWIGLESSAQQANNPKALYEDLLSKMKTKAEMIKDYQSNGNQFKDAKAFFLNEMEIVKTAESFLRLANGKKDLEDDVMTAKNMQRRLYSISLSELASSSIRSLLFRCDC